MPEGRTITTETGEQYYITGRERIKITEHFPASGEPLDKLIADLITQKVKENAGKSA